MTEASTETMPTFATDEAAVGVGDDRAAILVVDDTSVSRVLIGGLLARETGRPIVAAEDGLRALELLDAGGIAAVVTDLQMPGLNGLQLVEAIRDRHPSIPVILMTAYGSGSVAMKALRAGATCYVPKKYLARDLVRTLQRVLALVEGPRPRQRLFACQTSRAASYRFENDPQLLAPLVATIQEDLLAFGLGDETARMRVGVALHEALANALYHGNLECSSDLRQDDERLFYRQAEERRGLAPYRHRRIRVETSVDHRRARFAICDEGPGFDVASLDRPFDPDDLMRVGGRGMLLIRTFMDEVEHNETGNEITLIKYRGTGRPE